MRITGSRQRLCCGAWLLAAVLIAGLNVFALISMESQPAAGYSHTIRELRANLHKLDAILDAHGLTLPASWKLPEILSRSPAAGNASAGVTATRVPTAPRNQASEQTPLPALSGIIRTLDPDGSVCFQAVIEGRGYHEKDKLDDYTVDQIKPAGIILRHFDRTWFVPCPTPLFSSDQGE